MEAHLLRTNNWMDTHDFQDQVKVQRFCLTLVGEARLWYKSLRPINVDWVGLQNMFRQQYSNIGNIREQLFHAWRSFHFDENTETIDAYVNHIRQVATLLGYQEPQVLEVFRNTLPTQLYWVLFPIADLRLVVETAKRILTIEKIDNQLAGQTSSTTDDLQQNIDRLTVMMGKLVTEEEGQPKPLSHKYINPIEVGIRIEAIIEVDLGIIMPTGVVPSITRTLGAEQEVILIIEETMDIICEVIIYRNNYNNYRRNGYRGQSYDRNGSRSLDRQNRGRRNQRSISNGRSRSGSRASTYRDRIRCFECREYNHFARECPTR